MFEDLVCKHKTKKVQLLHFSHHSIAPWFHFRLFCLIWSFMPGGIQHTIVFLYTLNRGSRTVHFVGHKFRKPGPTGAISSFTFLKIGSLLGDSLISLQISKQWSRVSGIILILCKVASTAEFKLWAKQCRYRAVGSTALISDATFFVLFTPL